MLNPDGSRRYGAHCNMTVGDKTFTNTIDKPANEPGTNFPMFRGPSYSVEGTDMPSDRAEGFNTNLPDEETGNTNGHHSFVVVFQEAVADGAPAISPPAPPPPAPPPPPPPASPPVSNVPGTIRGVVQNAGGRGINLRGNGVDVSGPTGGDGSFGYDGVPAGTYTLTVVGTDVSGTLTVQPGQQANIMLTVPSAPPPPPPPPQQNLTPPSSGDLDAVRQQVTQLQQQLAQIGGDRDRLAAVLSQIKQVIQNAGL
jgi:hypothetical protein